MPDVRSITAFLEMFAPARLAAEWDNVGLLVGDAGRAVGRLMTCLTLTPASAAEAVARRADLVVTHHPLPFAALKRITTETVTGRMLLELIAARTAIYSPHTAFDSAAAGINQSLAEGLGLDDIRPLLPHAEGQGTGRCGQLPAPATLGELAARVKALLRIDGLYVVGDPAQRAARVAIGCGAAGDLLPAAGQQGCDAMLLGEARFHTCLEAEAAGIGLLLPGHFASERFGVERLAEVLARQFADLEVWLSQRERDPLRWM